MSTRPVVPTPHAADFLDGSRWIAARPGLRDEARRLLAALPERRNRAGHAARRLAKPSLHPDGLRSLAVLGGRVAGQLAAWATVDAMAGRLRRTRSPREAALARSEAILRRSGSTYVKLGQFVATSKGVLPDEIVERFAWCRDAVPAFSSGLARERIEREIGPLDRHFSSFDTEALSAASIAQVHAAVLHDGTPVVVKVRRPGLRKRFAADLRALALMAAFGERRAELARRANATGFVHLFASLVLEELDFRIEAANMVEMGILSEHAGMGYVRVPRPIPGLVSESVLVMERLAGVPYTAARERLDERVDSERLIRLAIQGVLEHTLVYGVFHGDLHAGNVLVDSDGTYGLIDYGIVGRLDDRERSTLVRFMLGFARGDTGLLVDALHEFGAIPSQGDVARVREVFAERGIGQFASITHDQILGETIRTVRTVIELGFTLPTELILFFKNLLYLNGLTAGLAPGHDLMSNLAPIFAHFSTRYADEIERTTGA